MQILKGPGSYGPTVLGIKTGHGTKLVLFTDLECPSPEVHQCISLGINLLVDIMVS